MSAPCSYCATHAVDKVVGYSVDSIPILEIADRVVGPSVHGIPWRIHDAVVELRIALILVSTERNTSSQALAHDTAQCPPVDGVGVVVALDHLWGEIFLCPNERVCAIPGELAISVRAKALAGVDGRSSLASNVVCWELDRYRISTVSKAF